MFLPFIYLSIKASHTIMVLGWSIMTKIREQSKSKREPKAPFSLTYNLLSFIPYPSSSSFLFYKAISVCKVVADAAAAEATLNPTCCFSCCSCC
ncbi:hypothetical protein RchiOBHm_Chr6g0306921 [Rosa chinensis]|uniref:Uncharacterized protein n=1 Tax=Rosa chinensis TaxID=74649 RepID=A0A2P6Q079_ROSCH|nr:hypothetical protein RchiOBHm_Chr6g0306921 [Rosa chinensis]